MLRGSAWVFSGAVASCRGEGEPGETADVLSHDGEWLGRGLWDPEGDMRVRILTRDEGEAIDGALFRRRVSAAMALRRPWFADGRTTAWRAFFSEADGLSGVIGDLYGGRLVLQLGARAWARHLPELAAAFAAEPEVEAVQALAEPDARKREDWPALPEAFTAAGGPVRVLENGFSFEVTPGAGQKTGFFLDQRENRRAVARHAAGRDVLSAYCYTGGFEAYAAAAGAKSVTGWDSSADALAAARRNQALNPAPVAVAYEEADVPRRLRLARDRGERWDLIVLDPPRLVTGRGNLERGLRAYKDINLLAMKLLRPGGILATFSCSGLVDAEAFRTMVGWAAHDAKRRVAVLERLGQPADHPVPVDMPECEYLKGLICAVS